MNAASLGSNGCAVSSRFRAPKPVLLKFGRRARTREVCLWFGNVVGQNFIYGRHLSGRATWWYAILSCGVCDPSAGTAGGGRCCSQREFVSTLEKNSVGSAARRAVGRRGAGWACWGRAACHPCTARRRPADGPPYLLCPGDVVLRPSRNIWVSLIILSTTSPRTQTFFLCAKQRVCSWH